MRVIHGLVFGWCVLAAGCASDKQRDADLMKVARNWCMTIRASQVIPVYPLTEDLLPGDVLLSTTPIGQEQQFYSANGFLPLDNLVCRLANFKQSDALPLDESIKSFYGDRFRDTTVKPSTFPLGGKWPGVPSVGFPSYSVQVSRSAGLNAAIPVQGIPLGLSFLGASSATACVTLKDAYSYGVDMVALMAAIDGWAKDEMVKEMLAPYGTVPVDEPDDQANYLRIVSRVFLVKRVNVTVLSNDSASGGGQFGGADVPGAQILTDKSAAESATDAVDRINASLAKSKTSDLNPTPPLPGAPGLPVALPSVAVRVVQATRRSVSLEEEFSRPLAIGYLAIDRQIWPGGELGPPVHTLMKIKGEKSNAPTDPQPALKSDDSTKRLRKWIARDKTGRTAQLQRWMTANQITATPADLLWAPQYAPQRKDAAAALAK